MDNQSWAGTRQDSGHEDFKLRRLASAPGCLAKGTGGRLIAKMAPALHLSLNSHLLQGDSAASLITNGVYILMLNLGWPCHLTADCSIRGGVPGLSLCLKGSSVPLLVLVGSCLHHVNRPGDLAEGTRGHMEPSQLS